MYVRTARVRRAPFAAGKIEGIGSVLRRKTREGKFCGRNVVALLFSCTVLTLTSNTAITHVYMYTTGNNNRDYVIRVKREFRRVSQSAKS